MLCSATKLSLNSVSGPHRTLTLSEESSLGLPAFAYYSMMAATDGGSKSRPQSAEFCNHLDWADDVLVELREFLSRNPKFRMDSGADLLHGIAPCEFCANVKPSHKTGSALSHVPVASYLGRVFLAHNRIEDRLVRQTRWKCLPA